VPGTHASRDIPIHQVIEGPDVQNRKRWAASVSHAKVAYVSGRDRGCFNVGTWVIHRTLHNNLIVCDYKRHYATC
jgi:hypothetical protein